MDLFGIVYDDLRKLAAHRLSRETPGQTLQPTALVHEVYIRLMAHRRDGEPRPAAEWKNSQHFFCVAAEVMQRILVDQARRKRVQKRGAGIARSAVDLDTVAQPEAGEALIELNDALEKFSVQEPLIARLVVLRYFGGFTLKEASAILEIPPRTGDSYWAYARAWLSNEMQSADDTADRQP